MRFHRTVRNKAPGSKSRRLCLVARRAALFTPYVNPEIVFLPVIHNPVNHNLISTGPVIQTSPGDTAHWRASTSTP